MLQDLLDNTYGLLLYDVLLCSLLLQMHVELLVAFPLPKSDI